MKCPYCGDIMEKGKIYSSIRYEPIIWIPEGHDIKCFCTQSKLEKANGLRLALPELKIEPTTLPTYICRKCKKGVFEYK